MAVRAKDIAREIGVSEATLSLVINGKPGLSQKTKTRVIQKLQELGYGYMLHTEKSRETSSKILSFVLYKNNGELLGMNSFFPLILDGIESTARKNGYTLNIINIERQHLKEQLKYIQDSGCAGFVIFATEMQEDAVDDFESLHIPFIIFDNYFNDRQINTVKVNNEQGTYIAVKYLYEMGHSKIGYLDSGLAINSFHERRRRAFDAIEDFGLENPRSYLYTIGYPNETAEVGMDKILDTTDPEQLPTAFLADNDLVAIGAMQSFKKHGYRIPEDFSFIGYDDRPICTLTEPKLTTVQLPRERFGSAAVEQLIRQIQEGSDSFTNIEINGTLIIRETVGKLTRKED